MNDLNHPLGYSVIYAFNGEYLALFCTQDGEIWGGEDKPFQLYKVAPSS